MGTVSLRLFANAVAGLLTGRWISKRDVVRKLETQDPKLHEQVKFQEQLPLRRAVLEFQQHPTLKLGWRFTCKYRRRDGASQSGNFFRFIEEVRRLWKQGLLPNSEELPNPKHHLHAYGPNLYQVNTHYVKPVTLAAGGMSLCLDEAP